MFCPACQGIGVARLHNDAIVVHLGDLGHFGSSGSPTADELCWKYAKHWIDIQLWGNHDRSVIDSWHEFAGYQRPGPAIKHMMQQRVDDGTLLLAYEAHGFLLTHAGLHAAFKHQNVPENLKTDPAAFAAWINEMSGWGFDPTAIDIEGAAICNAISGRRGGSSPFGGILWRDAGESLYPDFRQVFGHTAKPKVRQYQTKSGISYCVDIGDKNNGRLAAIHLPEERVVEVNLNVMSDGSSEVHDQDPGD
jgi:hypothetical protein